MPNCLHPSRFQMDGPADGKTRCALCELERVVLDHAAFLNDKATLLLRADRAEREVARLTDMLLVCECGHHAVAHEGRRLFCNMRGCGCTALRGQPAPAGGEEK